MTKTIEANISKRLDIYLALDLGYTRSYVKTLIDSGRILVDGNVVKAGYLVKVGQAITIDEPSIEHCDILPESIIFGVIYEDSHIAVIDKPQGLTVHPSNGVYTGTLVNGLMYRIRDLSSINGIIRPGIVHRLDKDTSGLMVIAKTNEAHLRLSDDIANRRVTKRYMSLVEGVMTKDSGNVRTYIARDPKERKRMAVVKAGGREAISSYKVIERYSRHTLVEWDILTGRTHQIRVHAKHIGHPVACDSTYGYKKPTIANQVGQLLHAYYLSFDHPITAERVEYSVAVPKHFEDAQKNARKG